MAKAGELDWSELHKKEELPANDVKDANKGGEQVTKSDIQKDVNFILGGFKQNGIRQPTDQEMFGHLIKTEAQAKAEQEASSWKNPDSVFKELQKPIDNKVQDWGNGKPMIDWENMTEEEKAKRNSFVGSDE